MDEYINREEAIEIAESCGTQNASHLGSVYSGSVIADYIAEYISMIPPADVAPVRHGRWICHPNDLFPGDSTQECSLCHEEEYLTLYNKNYCPNCGAKMDGDGNG